MRRDIMMLELILDSTLKITVLLIMYSGEKSVQSFGYITNMNPKFISNCSMQSIDDNKYKLCNVSAKHLQITFL